MEYVYAAMLLHKAGQAVTEESVKKVLEAAGVKSDSTKVKAMVASLEGVDIDTVVKEAAITQAAAAAPAKGEKKDEKKEEKKEESKESEAEAVAGLGALFG